MDTNEWGEGVIRQDTTGVRGIYKHHLGEGVIRHHWGEWVSNSCLNRTDQSAYDISHLHFPKH